MSTRTTIITVILAILAVAAVIVLPARETTWRESSGPQALAAVAPLADQSVHRITIHRAGEPAMVIVRAPDGWMQTEPFPCSMDRFSIDQLLSLAGKMRVLETLPSTEHRPTFRELSLDPPLATIRYEWDQGAVELAFGRPGLAGRAYLRVPGDDVIYVVSHELHDRVVAMDPREWRDRRLFRGPPLEGGFEPEQLIFAAGEQRIVLQRQHKRWLMQEPARTRADSAAVDELLAALARATNGGFILDQPDDLTRFGLNPPAALLTVIGSGPAAEGSASPRTAQQSLLVGTTIGVNSQDRFGLVGGQPVVVRLPAAVVAAIFRSRESFIEPTACGILPADVKTLRISGPDGEFRLQRDLERWIAPERGGGEVAAQPVNELLNLVTTIRASKISLAPFPREQQLGHVTLLGFDDRPLDTVRIARDPADGQWIMDNGDNVLRLYPASIQLRLSPDAFSPATPSG